MFLNALKFFEKRFQVLRIFEHYFFHFLVENGQNKRVLKIEATAISEILFLKKNGQIRK